MRVQTRNLVGLTQRRKDAVFAEKNQELFIEARVGRGYIRDGQPGGLDHT